MAGKRKSKRPTLVDEDVETALEIREKIRKGVWSGKIVPKDALNTLPWYKRIGAKLLTKILGNTLIEKTTPVKPRYIFQTGPQIRKPQYDYVSLFELSRTSWVLRQIFRAIIGEVINPRWTIKPRFYKKCKVCGREYQEPDREVCECGSKELVPPDHEQYLRFVQLLKKPNRDYNMDDFIRSTLWYDLALDDFYWGIVYSYIPQPDGTYKKIPREVYVEDARFIYPVADEYGHLGSYEYFCPICYELEKGDNYVDIRTLPPEERLNPKCPKCGYPLIQTCYVQVINGVITARFGRDEILHGSSSRVLPEFYGNSKLIAVWKLVKTLEAMVEYNWQVYSEGKAGSFIVFPGHEQEELDEMRRAMQNEILSMDRRDIQTGEPTRRLKIHTFFIGAKEPPVRIPIMEDFQKMQSIDFFKLYTEKICAVYGVTPVFVSVVEATRAGVNPRMQIDVQNRTTRRYQADIEDLFNDELLPIFGITDWIFKFGKVESRDVLREAQIEHEKATTVMTLRRAGYDVEIGDDWTLKVSRKPVRDVMRWYPSRLEEGKVPPDQRPPKIEEDEE